MKNVTLSDDQKAEPSLISVTVIFTLCSVYSLFLVLQIRHNDLAQNAVAQEPLFTVGVYVASEPNGFRAQQRGEVAALTSCQALSLSICSALKWPPAFLLLRTEAAVVRDDTAHTRHPEPRGGIAVTNG